MVGYQNGKIFVRVFCLGKVRLSIEVRLKGAFCCFMESMTFFNKQECLVHERFCFLQYKCEGFE